MQIKTIKGAFAALGECYAVSKGLEKAIQACNLILEKGTLSELEKASQYDFVKNNFQIRQQILSKIISQYTTIEQINNFRQQYTAGIINYLWLKPVLDQRETEIHIEQENKEMIKLLEERGYAVILKENWDAILACFPALSTALDALISKEEAEHRNAEQMEKIFAPHPTFDHRFDSIDR